MYNKIISIESQLEEIASENPKYKELWATWNLNKKTLEPILNAIIKDYPHYSLHDYSHSESILLNIERILGNKNIEKLSPTDLWLILHVAYLHDFGMVLLDTKIREFWNSRDFQDFLKEQCESVEDEFRKAAELIISTKKNKEKFDKTWPLQIKEAVTLLNSKYCREKHGNFSQNYILDINNIWGIDIGHNGLVKKRLISLVADISAIHTKPFEEVFKLHKTANGFKGDYTHPRLVACLLRLGDALDLDNGRFNYCGEKIFGKLPEDSQIHYGKHEATIHVLVTNELIEVGADCPTDDIYRETRKWYDSLKNEIENMYLNWSDIAPSDFSYPPKLTQYKILRDGIESPYELANLKFSIAQSKAFEILEGSSLYKDKFSCIREIVQNAEDASKIQMWRDIKNGMYYCVNGIKKEKVEDKSILPGDIPEWIYEIYSIEIHVEEIEDENVEITITDHGTGISLDTLKQICNVGQSYFQKKEKKKEIEEIPVWLRPTASFGIGLQSCFMITDTLTIYTNSGDGETSKITFKSGKEEGYVSVDRTEEFLPRGSKVVLQVSNSLDFRYTMFGFTDKKIQRMDPFESRCIVIYKVIESVFNECSSSFFEIKVISDSIKFEDNISANMSLAKGFPNGEKREDIYYSLNDDKDEITSWYNNNLYKIKLVKSDYSNVLVKFKGKDINKTNINPITYRGFFISVDIYGIATKKALSLNREELSKEAARIIKKDIDKIIKMYFEVLEDKEESIKDNKKLLSAYMVTSWLYGKEFPKSLHKYVDTEETVEIATYNEKRNLYEPKRISLGSIAGKFPEMYFVDEIAVTNSIMNNDAYRVEKVIKILNDKIDDKKQYKEIIIDDEIRKYLELCWCNWYYTTEEFCICKVYLNEELYSPDPEIRKILINELVYQERGVSYPNNCIMRRAIPAFSTYSKLAVRVERINLIGRKRKSKWNIISPISMEDAKKMGEYSKEAFIEFIVKKEVFDNLVEYVLENGKEKCSKNQIIEEYKKLIGEYYDSVDSKK